MSLTNQPIRVALIGYGQSGKIFHAPFISTTPGLQLTVVGSSQPATVLADYPEVEVVPTEAAAVHPAIDVVVIATPNDRHAPLAQLALAAGKHVVVDKPFALSLGEARQLVALAQDKQRLLSVFQNRRWDSDYVAVKAALAQQLIGRVTHFESHIDRYRPKVLDRWREQALPGSGLWWDLGPHLIDQVLQLFGLPDAVTAQLAVMRDGAQSDDWAHVVLAYGDGLRIILHATSLAAGGSPRFIVHGTLGSLIKRKADIQEDQLKAGIGPGATGWGLDPDPLLIYDSNGTLRQAPAPSGDFGAYYRAIQAALATGSPNPVLPAHALGVMAVLETAKASHLQAKTLVLPLTDEERAAWNH